MAACILTRLCVARVVISRFGHFCLRVRAASTDGKEAGWAPEPFWIFWRTEYLFPLLGIQPYFLGSLVRRLVFIAT